MYCDTRYQIIYSMEDPGASSGGAQCSQQLGKIVDRHVLESQRQLAACHFWIRQETQLSLSYFGLVNASGGMVGRWGPVHFHLTALVDEVLSMEEKPSTCGDCPTCLYLVRCFRPVLTNLTGQTQPSGVVVEIANGRM